MNIIKPCNQVLPSPVQSLKRLSGGKNSRVFALTLLDTSKVILKQHYAKQTRLAQEWNALELLHRHHITCVPKPVAKFEEYNFALYSFCKGHKLQKTTIKDLKPLIIFLEKLFELTVSLQNKKIPYPRASEACFYLSEIEKNLNKRFNSLIAIKSLPESRILSTAHNFIDLQIIYAQLFNFLELKLKPTCIKYLQQAYTASLNEHSYNLDAQDSILSPSDFGFHNILVDDAQNYCFLDFEHFGLDDPVKLVSDFFLHPAMDLNFEQKQYFKQEVFRLFPNPPQLEWRFNLLFPLWKIKWSLILLNEFIPHNLLRRQFALPQTKKDHLQILQTQLGKAKDMLDVFLSY